MICPDCKAENIAGVDYCVSCGADLHDLSRPGAEDEFDEFTDHLLHDHLGDLQAEEPPAAAPSDPVAYAIHLMQQSGVACILVKQGDDLVGIITERDVLLKAAGDNVDLNALAVGDLMTRDPVILREEDSLAVALHKMSVGGFRHIPLMREGRVTRVVSIRDVVRHISPFIPNVATKVP